MDRQKEEDVEDELLDDEESGHEPEEDNDVDEEEEAGESPDSDDDNSEDSSSDEEEEEPEEDEPKEAPESKKEDKKPKEVDYRTRLNRARREKYQAEEYARRLSDENERLRQMSQLSTQAAMLHHEDSIQQKMDYAKHQLASAIESGDAEAQANAQVALNLATHELASANSYKAEQAYRQQYDNQNQQYQNPDPFRAKYPMYRQEEVEDFFEDNPYLNEKSPYFNKQIMENFMRTAQEVDDELTAEGNAHLIGSNQYLRFMDKAVKSLVGQHVGKRSLPMKQSRVPAAPSRGSSFGSSVERKNKQYKKLSPEDRENAREMGVSEEAWARELLRAERQLAKQNPISVQQRY